MIGSFYKRGKFAWVQDVRANFVCIKDGELAATVFSTLSEPWQVILHLAQGPTLVEHEFYGEPQAAMSRAEEFLDGRATKGFRHLIPSGLLSRVIRGSL